MAACRSNLRCRLPLPCLQIPNSRSVARHAQSVAMKHGDHRLGSMPTPPRSPIVMFAFSASLMVFSPSNLQRKRMLDQCLVPSRDIKRLVSFYVAVLAPQSAPGIRVYSALPTSRILTVTASSLFGRAGNTPNRNDTLRMLKTLFCHKCLQ